MSARADEIEDFLTRAGWADARREAIPGDASTRRYERLFRGGRSYILMDQPRGAETAACPPEATPDERRALGYNALARLAGPDTRPFAAIAGYLRKRGFSAPELFAEDHARGLLVLEDLGRDRYAESVEKGADATLLYGAAMDLLAALHAEAAPATLPIQGGAVPLLTYDAAALAVESDLLIEWFLPLATGRPTPPDQAAAYRGLWAEALAALPQDRAVLTLRDYHAENLLWLPDRSETARVGLIDFQDGLAGNRAYDLISLLEDARRDVDPALAAAMTKRYVGAVRAREPGFDADAFALAAALLAAQRNAKIIGIFARLWKRDGKPRYLSYLPRLWGYMARDLAHPRLARLKRWFDGAVPAELRGALPPR